jgi:hypothetical protein
LDRDSFIWISEYYIDSYPDPTFEPDCKKILIKNVKGAGIDSPHHLQRVDKKRLGSTKNSDFGRGKA